MSTDFMHISPSNLNNGFFKVENSKKESKPNDEAELAADDKLQKCYNPAFCGLFKQGGYDSSKDLRVAFSDVVMPPFKDFIVDENSEITGKNKLRFKKDNEGYLHAMNIAPCFSDYPVLKQSAAYLPMERDTLLLSGVRYASYCDTKLMKNDFEFDMFDYPEVMALPENGSIIVGSSDEADIKPENSDGKIAGKQWKIEKKGYYYVITDLTKEGGSVAHGRKGEFSKENNPDFICNFPTSKVSKDDDITSLKPFEPAIVPSDSKIFIGHDYLLDLKNKEFLNKFKYKDTVIIGRKNNSDIKLDNFYSFVAGNHTAVKKCGDAFVVCDLGSKNGTKIVPNKAFKPFLDGVQRTHFSQGTVGDCYLLAPLYALSRNEKGAEILENIVKTDSDGNYRVKFHDSPTFIIRSDDFSDDKYRDEIKIGAEGNSAIMAIEKAYARYVKPISILGGKKDREMFSKVDEGGFEDKVFYVLTGKRAYEFSVQNYSADELLRKLANSKRNGKILTCASKHDSESKSDYLDSNKKILSGHAYAVGRIFEDSRQVEIINPHDTKRPIRIGIDGFKKYFGSITLLDLN